MEMLYFINETENKSLALRLLFFRAKTFPGTGIKQVFSGQQKR